MKRIFFSAFVLLLSLIGYSQAGSVKPRVIVNPSYEVKSSGIFNITKIEQSDTETRLTVQITFVPGWWVSFSNDDAISDSETGKTYQIKGIEGGELGKRITMPSSGDSTIVLIYPALDELVRKIDFGKSVYGLSLDASKAGVRGSSAVPAQVSKWLNQELGRVKSKVPVDLNSPKFFGKGSGRLIGYIKGYDTRLGFSTGLVYMRNELTGEDYPAVVQIYPDGHFEADLPFEFPKCSMMLLKDNWIPFYLESGQTLAMILDWEEFLNADRMRNVRYKFKNVTYQGPLAKINTELAGFSPDELNYEEFQKKIKMLTPAEFKSEQMKVLEANQQLVENYVKANTLSPQAISILRNSTLLESATLLFDFVMNREYQARQDTANEILKIPADLTYYDFLKEIPLNDNSLLVLRNFGTFVNRFEFCDPLIKGEAGTLASVSKPEKDFFTYLLEENKNISEEDKELIVLLQKEERTEKEMLMAESKKDQIKDFYERNKDHSLAYAEKYVKPLNKAWFARYSQERWRVKDSVLRSDLGLEPSLIYEIAKVRSLKFMFEESSRELAKGIWDFLQKGITNPYLLETGNLLYAKSFPEEKAAAYKLPQGIATDIFRKIVDPFKGKVLFVDFWATTCGPCVGEIERMKPIREKYKDNKDFAFIFITDERSSPITAYNKFVKEQGLKNIYRLPVDDYNYLRQLFKFNGIPRYIVIDRQGNVLSNNFEMHNFESELNGILSDK